MTRAAQAFRLFARMRGMPAEVRRLSNAEVFAEFERRRQTRNQRFVESLDRLVWSVPTSPYLPLLAHAGVKAGDLRALVATRGLEGALADLRDAGVYISYAEWLGTAPARRGSTTFEFSPDRFFNPRTTKDYTVRTGGTRTEGIPITVSLANLRRLLWTFRLFMASYDVWDAPSATWLPVFPSSGPIAAVVMSALGRPVQRWFSPIDPAVRGIAVRKRAVNAALTPTLRALGLRVPRPEFAPLTDPDPVVDWCREALEASGTAFLIGVANLVAAAARRAGERGIRLDGLVVVMGGEPLTAAKADAVRASGAKAANGYGFMQLGAATGLSCPNCGDEEVHVLEDSVAVIDRPVTRPDGVTVPALLWTTLDDDAASVFLNVENDDYGRIFGTDEPCPCRFSAMGYRTKLEGIRGISKVVAAGVTVPGEVFERLAEHDLPAKFGGGPGDYQFVEDEVGGKAAFSLRIAPSVGFVDSGAAAFVVREALRATDAGVLAEESWRSEDFVAIERTAPVATRAGKVLPLEVMRRAPGS